MQRIACSRAEGVVSKRWAGKQWAGKQWAGKQWAGKQWAGKIDGSSRPAFGLMAGVLALLAGNACGGTSAGGTDAGAYGGTGTGGVTASGGGGSPSGTGGTIGGTGGSGVGGRGTGGSTGGGGTTATGGRIMSGGGGANTTTNPVIPAIMGTCPVFTTGTATIGGLGGIALQVGPKSQGTGSLVFYWHGTGSTAGEVNSLLPPPVRQEILAQGGIIVSFQGSLGTGGDCSGTNTFSKDDFRIADLIAACAIRDQGIDPRRIYTTGCSAGGLQAGCMGALRSSYIAAVVPNSGGEVTSLAIQDANHVPAVMTMHGGSSDMVIVSFAMTSARYDTQIKGAGGFVVNCNHGGGHCQAPAALYTAGWDFMKAHPFGVAPEPYASALPTSYPTYCATF
jgi:dienelactone hydrolase